MNELSKIDILHPQEPHSALVLLLDTSGSMNEEDKIGQLNAGLTTLKEELMRDDLNRKRLDVAIITFNGDVTLIQDFSPINNVVLPTLRADGETSMGSAIIRAIELVEDRKSEYKRLGIDYTRPWIFMISDGEPTDMSPGKGLWKQVTSYIQEGEYNKKFTFYTVGVEPSDMTVLKQLSPNRYPMMLTRGHFDDLFTWLSRSQGEICRQGGILRPGDQIELPDPKVWGKVCV
jgi:uncharacterized protein YegL